MEVHNSMPLLITETTAVIIRDGHSVEFDAI